MKHFLVVTTAIFVMASFTSLPIEARTISYTTPCQDWPTANACNSMAQGRIIGGVEEHNDCTQGHCEKYAICHQCGWDPARKPHCVAAGQVACY